MFDVLAFSAFVSISSITPGPNNCMALSHAGARGLRRGLLFSVGVFFGMLAVMALCAAGGGFLAGNLRHAQSVMKYAGAAYMLYLAWSVARSRGETRPREQSNGHALISGGVLQLVNPKVIIYGLTAFSVFILPVYSDGPHLAGFAVILALGGFIGTCCWAFFGVALERAFHEHPKLINGLLAGLLVYCAVSMLF